MDSTEARILYAKHATAMAYIDVQKPDGERGIGTAFHIGEGIFLTARHVVERNNILEVKITQHVGVSSREFLRGILDREPTADEVERHEAPYRSAGVEQPLFKKFLLPLEVVEGPYFADDPNLDVAVFRVRKIHPAAAIIMLGFHWDDWIDRGGVWHLSEAVVLGYPPVPMCNEPLLISAKAEIHGFFVPRHVRFVHFLLSAVPRGGFSGGVAIHENGHALGIITSALIHDDQPEQLGFFAVLSVEGIVKCLEASNLYPTVQKQHHDSAIEQIIGKSLEQLKRERFQSKAESETDGR